MENKRKIFMYITLKQLNKSNNVKTKLIQIKKFELQFSVHWPYCYNPDLLHNLNNLNTLIPFRSVSLSVNCDIAVLPTPIPQRRKNELLVKPAICFRDL